MAILFIGIFMSMMPALIILEARGARTGLEPALALLLGDGNACRAFSTTPRPISPSCPPHTGLGLPAEVGGIPAKLLAALSAGAVFMGANSYIGNGPNFMVKAIAEEQGVKMPSFLGYMVYSGAVLIPIFVVVTFVFFV